MPFKARSNDQNKLIVVGIAKTVDDAALSDMFGLYGTVAEAKVVLDDKKQSRGFGFVTYTSAAAKNKAIKHMNQTTVDGRVLTVRDVIPKADREAKKEEVAAPKTGVCWAFQKGLCDKGDACKYPHEVKDGEYGSCFEFVQSGKCKRGDQCKFSHGGTTNANGSTTEKPKSTASNEEPAAPPADKPRVCFAFQKGKCHRGKACLFVHEQLELPKGTSEGSATDSKKRKRDDQEGAESLEAQLTALIAAEEKAYEEYEAAKAKRQEVELQIAQARMTKPDKTKKAESKKTTLGDKAVKVKEEIKQEKTTIKLEKAASTTEKKPKVSSSTGGEDKKKPADKPVKKQAEPIKVEAKNVQQATGDDDSDDDDEVVPAFEAASFDDDDDGADFSLSAIIQNAVSEMKKADAASTVYDSDDTEELPRKAAKASTKPSKPAAPAKAAKKQAKPVSVTPVRVKDEVDMGAAFDDEPPKKKAKGLNGAPSPGGGERLKASDHRKLRQLKKRQKKEALARLKSKQEIQVDHS
ncbi:hypothetical protein LEN26_010604 [Aphanomyces euteiches]|nr:hypothetical protein LEN26_010604 [Aphanomyces euteiches]